MAIRQTIKIVTKKSNGEKLDGVGLGNQIWWIPAIKHLRKQGNFVCTDSRFLYDIGACSHLLIGPDRHVDRVYIPAYPSWKDVLNVRWQYPFADIRGIRYKAKGFKIGLGYNHSVAVNDSISELETIRKLVPNNELFHLAGHNPQKNLVVLGTSNKSKCYYPYWDWLEEIIKKTGYDVVYIGELGRMYNSYTRLFNVIKHAEYYIGVDSGIMHLADVLGVPGLVFWGSTVFEKNRPINNLKIIKGLHIKPSKELIMSMFLRQER